MCYSLGMHADRAAAWHLGSLHAFCRMPHVMWQPESMTWRPGSCEAWAYAQVAALAVRRLSIHCLVSHGRMRRWLLASITALGVLSAVAFSASYQMVARFANKNVVALGLGCAGCGLIVLGLELALGALPMRVRVRNIWLLELTAGAHWVACSAQCSHRLAAVIGALVYVATLKLERLANADLHRSTALHTGVMG